MTHIQLGPDDTKMLKELPEVIELTEARKRAVAGGRASLEEAFRQMVADAQRPLPQNVVDGDEETSVDLAARRQQQLAQQARFAAISANVQNQKEAA